MKYQKYLAYKDSGVEWLGTIPSHWEALPIKYVASSNDDVLTEGTAEDFEIEYVEISGVDEVKGVFSTEAHQFKNAPSRARRRVRGGDIIISTVRTYLKAIASIVNPPDNLIVSTGFAVIRPKNSLLPRFASYLFKTSYLVHEVIARSTGVSYPAINTSELVRIHAVLPPQDEQTTIAAFLDQETAQIDTLIAKQERLIATLQEKRQALISHAVTKGLNPDAAMKESGVEWLGEIPDNWKLIPFGYLLERIETGWTPNSEQRLAEDDEWAVLKVGCIRNGKFYQDEHKALAPSVKPDPSLEVHSGDLLMSRANTLELAGSVGLARLRLRPTRCR